MGARQSGWLRDTAGLWIRFSAMYADGELDVDAADGERMRKAADAAIAIFEADHGGDPHFLGAIYQQAAVALLCTVISGSSSKTVAALTKRVGEAVLRVFAKHYSSQAGAKARVRERLTQDYVEGTSELVWGPVRSQDLVLRTFFT